MATDEARNSPFKPIPQTLQHVPLERPDNQIRLLTLSYDDTRQKLSGKLKVVSFDDDPIYDAISYVWGDLNDLSQIIVDGQEFNVTKNQEQCLQSFHAKGVTVVWMDGICIDQHNLSERNIQVSNMKRVYQVADHVHVWMYHEIDYAGLQEVQHKLTTRIMEEFWHKLPWDNILKQATTAPTDTDAEMSELGPDQLRTELLQMVELMKARRPLTQLPFYHTQASDGKPLPRISWYTAQYLFYEIYNSAWWERVWVLQEVLFCKVEPQFHVGSIALPMMPILVACRYFQNQDYYLNEPNISLDPVGTRRLRKTVFPTISVMRDTSHLYQATMLLETRAGLRMLKKRNIDGLPPHLTFGLAFERKASDPRDYIYGMLGLLENHSKFEIQPDYNDQDVSSLYVKASRHVVQFRGGLDLQVSRGAPDIHCEPKEYGWHDENEPTWAVEWREEKKGPRWLPEKRVKAHGDTKHTPSTKDISPRHLTVTGSQVGVVTEIGLRISHLAPNTGWTANSALDIIDSWRRLSGLNDSNTSQQTSQETSRLENRFWRNITDGQPTDDTNAGKYSWTNWQPRPETGDYEPWKLRDYGPNLKFKWSTLKSGYTQTHADEARVSTAQLEDNARGSIRYHTIRKVMFRIAPEREEFFATGPPVGVGRRMTEVGDVLVILKGFHLPSILRETEEGTWKWVGPAYVDELMDGQWIGPDTLWRSYTLV